MMIEFYQEGGYANLRLHHRVDTGDLSGKDAREIEDLVETSGLLREGEREPVQPVGGRPRVADVFTYKIAFTKGGKTNSFSFDDLNAPQEVRPLLTRLGEMALREKSDK